MTQHVRVCMYAYVYVYRCSDFLFLQTFSLVVLVSWWSDSRTRPISPHYEYSSFRYAGVIKGLTTLLSVECKAIAVRQARLSRLFQAPRGPISAHSIRGSPAGCLVPGGLLVRF